MSEPDYEDLSQLASWRQSLGHQEAHEILYTTVLLSHSIELSQRAQFYPPIAVLAIVYRAN